MTTIPNSAPQPKNAGLAVWSLVLGILGLLCLPLVASVPAVICGHVAQSRIRRSGGLLGGNGLAVAGLVTGYIGVAYAVVVVPLLLAIAIPNFVRARTVAQHTVCRMNVEMIANAKELWAVENKKPQSATPTEADLAPYLKDKKLPVCPAGGSYTLKPVSETAVCSLPEHSR